MEQPGWKAVQRIELSGGSGTLPLVTFKGGNGRDQVRYRKDPTG